jgi:putative tryptophan/tyrosine transport system substrate-binding protein
MTEIFKKCGKTNIIFLVTIFLLLTEVVAGDAVDRLFTIGIVNSVPVLSQTIEGFKAGMTELGYVEGKNVKYIFNGLLENNQKIIDAEIKNLLSQNIDMLLTVGNESALRAKKAVEGTGMPVLVSSFHRPVESGLIASMTRPGGNITGVAGLDRAAKALEWLKIIIPGLKKVYLPYNPDDAVSVISIAGLDKAASQMGIELVFQKVHSVEETVTAIKNLPKDIKAIFMIPSPTLNSRNSELSQAAIKRGLPMGANLSLNKEVLATFATDLFDIGKHTARLADQVRLGAKPADIPFETSDVYLTINLETAEKIGLTIPDDVLAQAKTIIR